MSYRTVKSASEFDFSATIAPSSSSIIRIGVEPPTVVREYLKGVASNWFTTSIDLPETDVDPVFREISKRLPEQRLVLFSGSDVIQLELGIAKQIRFGVVEVNALAAPGKGALESFIVLPDFPIPQFKERASQFGRVEINGESGSELATLVSNANRGAFLLKGPLQVLNHPNKSGLVVEVTPSGPARMFFRTPKECSDYLHRKLALTDITATSVDDWLAQNDNEVWQVDAVYLLHYAAIVTERAAKLGWSWEERSIKFLRELAGKLSEQFKNDVRSITQTLFANSGFAAPTLDQTFQELGLS